MKFSKMLWVMMLLSSNYMAYGSSQDLTQRLDSDDEMEEISLEKAYQPKRCNAGLAEDWKKLDQYKKAFADHAPAIAAASVTSASSQQLPDRSQSLPLSHSTSQLPTYRAIPVRSSPNGASSSSKLVDVCLDDCALDNLAKNGAASLHEIRQKSAAWSKNNHTH